MFNLTYGIPNSLVLPGNLTVAGTLNTSSITVNGKTLSISGNLSTSGTYSIILGATGDTYVVLPLSGILATQLGYEPLSNKSINASTVSNSTINGSTIGATTPASGAFTNLTVTSNAQLPATQLTSVTVNTATPDSQAVLCGPAPSLKLSTTPSPTVLNNGAICVFALANRNGDFGLNSGDALLAMYGNERGNLYIDPNYAGSGTKSVAIRSDVIATGAYSVTNSYAIRSTKNNFNITLNIRDFGAVGDNSTNSTSAIASAISALPSLGGTLVIPAGTFITDTMFFSNKSGITICGDGMGTSILKSRNGSQVLNISQTCSGFSIHDLTINGNCTGRTAGQQAVVCSATKSAFYNNEVLKAGEFAVYFGGDGDVDSCSITNNWIHDVYADGINVAGFTNGIIANNIIQSDDDCIALSRRSTTFAANNLISNNQCSARNDLGTTWGRGLVAIDGANNNMFVGNKLRQVKQYGLYVSSEGGYRPSYNSFTNNVYTNCGVNAGGGAFIDRANNTIINGESMLNPLQGDAYLFADVSGLTIQNSVIQQTGNFYCRGIHAVESAAGYTPIWGQIKIKGNSIDLFGPSTNEGIYLSPAAGITLSGVVIDGNASYIGSAGNSIVTNRLTGFAKIVNNTATNGVTAPSNGGIGIAPTLANNN